MFQIFTQFNTIFNDAPQNWQLGFQDSATPGFSGIVELHDTIFFYLIIISVGVFWVLGNIIYTFNSSRSSLVYKYLNHGTLICLDTFFKKVFKSIFLSSSSSTSFPCFRLCDSNAIIVREKTVALSKASNRNTSIHGKNRTINSNTFFNVNQPFHISLVCAGAASKGIRNYSNNSITPVKIYNNAETKKADILLDNKNKSGIYRWVNKINGKIYIGSSIDLGKRFSRYFNLPYISRVKNHLTISRAIISYGYSNFTIEILEYCDIGQLLIREQFYMDLFKPEYNIAKIAGSTLGVIPSESTKNLISESLKTYYINNESKLIGKTHTDETKKLMSISKEGEKNNMFGKTHNAKTIELMRNVKLGKTLDLKTRKAITTALGSKVYIYKLSTDSGMPLALATRVKTYLFLNQCDSIREAGRYLNISKGTVARYLKSGELYKGIYKFSSKSLEN